MTGPGRTSVVVEVWGYSLRDRRDAEADARRRAAWRGLEVAEVRTRAEAHPSARGEDVLEQEASFDQTWAILWPAAWVPR